MAAPVPPNMGAAALAAATVPTDTPAGVPAPTTGVGRQYLNLPPTDRAPGDALHSVDHNMIVEAIKALEWAYFVLNVGPEGAKGEKGDPGGFRFLGTVPTVSALPTGALAGDCWLATDTGNAHVWDGKGWFDLGPLQGVPGAEGPQGVQGPAGVGLNVHPPVPNEAARLALPQTPGLSVLQVDTGVFWTSDGTAWHDGGRLVGPQGVAGPKGDAGLRGVDGLPGPTGQTGAAGPTGPVGPTGADSIVPGPAGPTGATGPQGAASTVPGPKGDKGAKGDTGTGFILKGTKPDVASLPATGNTVGDAFMVAADTHVHIWNGTGWDDAGPLTGPKGDPGPAGADSVVPGPAGPAGPAGADGAASTVPGPAGPKGDPGVAGPAGADGAVGPAGPKGDPGDAGAGAAGGAVWAGDYTPMPFPKGSIVTFEGDLYSAMKDTAAGAPTPAAPDWMKMVDGAGAPLGLDDLTDVDLTGATDGQALVKTAAGWKPGTVAGAAPDLSGYALLAGAPFVGNVTAPGLAPDAGASVRNTFFLTAPPPDTLGSDGDVAIVIV